MTKNMKNYAEQLAAVLNLVRVLADRDEEMEFCYHPAPEPHPDWPNPLPSFWVEFRMPKGKIPQYEDEDYDPDWEAYCCGPKIRAHSGANGNLELTAFDLYKSPDWCSENYFKDFFAQFKGEFNPCLDGNYSEVGIEVPPSELMRVLMATCQ